MGSIHQPENMLINQTPTHFTIGEFRYHPELLQQTQISFFYLFSFSVDSKLNLVKRVVGDGGDLPGAGHGGESCYLFR